MECFFYFLNKFNDRKEIDQTETKYLVVFVPRQGLRAQNEPVISRTAFHDAQIGDGHVAFADDLIAKLSSCIAGILRRLLGAIKVGDKKKKAKCVRETLEQQLRQVHPIN